MNSKYAESILWVALMAIVCSCSVGDKLKNTGYKPVVSLADNALKQEVEVFASVPALEAEMGLTPKKKKGDDEQKRTRDEVTGEDVVTVDLDEISVVARSRTVPERLGKVKLDFVITLPKKLVDKKWMVTITPGLVRNGEITKLDDVVINGEIYRLYQEKGAAMYEALVERYKTFSRDTTRIWDYFAEKYNFQRNMDARLDTIMPSGNNFDYYYTQEVSANNSKRIGLFLEGQVATLDKSVYTIPLSDTISYFVSSMSQLIDFAPRVNVENDGTKKIDRRYKKAVELLEDREYEKGLAILKDYDDYNTAVAYVGLGKDEMAYATLIRQPITGDTEYLLAILSSRMDKEEDAIGHFLHACKLDNSKILRGELDPEISRLIKTYDLKDDLDNIGL